MVIDISMNPGMEGEHTRRLVWVDDAVFGSYHQGIDGPEMAPPAHGFLPLATLIGTPHSIKARLAKLLFSSPPFAAGSITFADDPMFNTQVAWERVFSLDGLTSYGAGMAAAEKSFWILDFLDDADDLPLQFGVRLRSLFERPERAIGALRIVVFSRAPVEEMEQEVNDILAPMGGTGSSTAQPGMVTANEVLMASTNDLQSVKFIEEHARSALA